MKNYLVEWFYKREIEIIFRKHLNASERKIKELFKNRKVIIKVKFPDNKKRKICVEIGDCANTCILKTLIDLICWNLDAVKTGKICVSETSKYNHSIRRRDIRDTGLVGHYECKWQDTVLRFFFSTGFILFSLMMVVTLFDYFNR